jgi:hypothetical protein
VTHLASQLGLIAPAWPGEAHGTKSLYRYQAAVRAYLAVTPYGTAAEQLVTTTTLQAAEVMSDPADLINRAVEALQVASMDLPAFSTLDRLVNRLRAEVHERMYLRVAERITAEQMAVLDGLLIKPATSTTTPFNRLKQTPGPATPATISLWVDRLTNSKDLRKLRAILPDPVARAHFLSDAGDLESAQIRVRQAEKRSNDGLLTDLEAAVQTMKNAPWTAVQELKGDVDVLKKIDDAEKLLQSLRQALTSI